jgi:hypothetical protein
MDIRVAGMDNKNLKKGNKPCQKKPRKNIAQPRK